MAAAGLALAVLTAGTGTTLSGWTTGSLTNSTDRAAVDTLSVTHAYTGGPCVGGPRTATVTCPGGIQPTTSPGATASDAITDNGGTSLTQSLSASSCGPVRFLNSQQASDPLMPRNAVAFQQPDPWGGSAAAAFSGSGYATDLVGTTGSGLLGLLSNNYSFGLWFNASDAQGGGLMSLSSSLSNASGAANPALWLDTAGKVHMAVSSTLGTSQWASSSSYSSGWHFAVVTVSKAVLGVLMTVTLYVDGASQASGTVLALLTGTSGYWHVGWSDFSGLTAPTSSYFHGRLAGVFVNRTAALSASDVAGLQGASSSSAYVSAASALSGTASVWALGDDGITTYAGALPGGMLDPCSQVNVAMAFTNPTASVAATSLTSFVAAGNNPRSIAAPAPGTTQGLVVTTSKGSGYSTDIAGLRLYVPITFTYGTVPSTGWTMAMRWIGDPQGVFLG